MDVDPNKYKWKLTNAGVALIKCNDFESESIDIPSIVAGRAVESIEEGAFARCDRLKAIKIPSSVKKIGASAFEGCSSLSSATIAEGCVAIGSRAFARCVALSQISLPDTLETIGSCAFLEAYSLTSVSLGARVKQLGGSAFEGSGVQSFEVSSKNETLQTFGGALVAKTSEGHALVAYPCGSPEESYEIPESVFAIGDGAFARAVNLKLISTQSVNSQLRRIGARAFCDCVNLTSLRIYDKVLNEKDELGADAFAGCVALKELNLSTYTAERIPDGAFAGCRSLQSLEFPEGVRAIGKRAFYQCENLTELKRLYSVSVVEEEAFAECSSLVHLEIDLKGELVEIKSGAYRGCDAIVALTLPSSLKRLGARAFQDCGRLQNIVLPATLESVGDEVFVGATALEKISISEPPEPRRAPLLQRRSSAQRAAGRFAILATGELVDASESRILAYPAAREPLQGVINLESTSVAPHAYDSARGVKTVIVGPNVAEIGIGAFANCENLQTVVFLGGKLTAIAAETFARCENLASIALPGSTRAIGSRAFFHCDNLRDVTLPNGLEELGDYAFARCFRLGGISLPSSLTSVGLNPFSHAVSLRAVSSASERFASRDGALWDREEATLISVLPGAELAEFTIPSEISTIAPRAFEGSRIAEFRVDPSNESYVARDGVLYSADERTLVAYPSHKAAERFEVPETVERIFSGAFVNAKELKELALPTTLREIPDAMCRQCSNLVSATGLDAVETIGYDAFADCDRLEKLRLGLKTAAIPDGSIPDECVLEVYEASTARVLAERLGAPTSVLEYSASLNALECRPCQGGVEIVKADPFLSGVVTIPEEVDGVATARICAGAFDGCANVEAIVLPASIVEIEPGAFSGATKLERFEVSDRSASFKASNGALMSYDGTRLVAYPIGAKDANFAVDATTKRIEALAFAGASNLSVVIANNVEVVGSRAFENCERLVALIASNLFWIEDGAFRGCSSFMQIQLNEGLTTIGARAFEGCALGRVFLPNSLKTIGVDAFDTGAQLAGAQGSAAEAWAKENGRRFDAS